MKSHGEALRIIAGAASGGALLIVPPGANIHTAKDLANKKLADPQLGGTQDISLRYYLQQDGLSPVEIGGNVQIIPTDNPTILTLFKQGKIDGAWVPEPWATRLIVEGNGDHNMQPELAHSVAQVSSCNWVALILHTEIRDSKGETDLDHTA